MNTFIWIVGGAVLAWLALKYLDLNKSRGVVIALVIGAVGGYFGGSVLAPLFGQASVTGEFRPMASLMAAVTAGSFLVAGDMVYEHFGV